MGYEIDFLAVGDGERSGDAIAMRFGDLSNPRAQTVIVIDGGFKSKRDGERLANLVQAYYNPICVDYVISTHPHEDHIGGLEAVVGSGLRIGTLLMHQPWEYAPAKEWQPSVERAHSLFTKARKLGITVDLPFLGYTRSHLGGRIQILGPSAGYYQSLLREHPDAPNTEDEFPKVSHEGWHQDTIINGAKTSATNNTSVILEVVADIDNGTQHRCLFTGDAGIEALGKAADYLVAYPNIIQIPHHGSKHNVGPDILNRIIGNVVDEGVQTHVQAVVSCAQHGGAKHPNQRVVNAFTRRGATCYPTQGGNILFRRNVPRRNDYNRSVAAIDFSEFVGGDD